MAFLLLRVLKQCCGLAFRVACTKLNILTQSIITASYIAAQIGAQKLTIKKVLA